MIFFDLTLIWTQLTMTSGDIVQEKSLKACGSWQLFLCRESKMAACGVPSCHHSHTCGLFSWDLRSKISFTSADLKICCCHNYNWLRTSSWRISRSRFYMFGWVQIFHCLSKNRENQHCFSLVLFSVPTYIHIGPDLNPPLLVLRVGTFTAMHCWIPQTVKHLSGCHPQSICPFLFPTTENNKNFQVAPSRAIFTFTGIPRKTFSLLCKKTPIMYEFWSKLFKVTKIVRKFVHRTSCWLNKCNIFFKCP